MEILKLEDIKKSDGWKYLSERSSKFEILASKFLKEAESFINPLVFSAVGILNSNEGVAVNYETYYYGSKKVVFSYNSKPTNRDLDCQFKTFRKVEFSLDDAGNLVVNDLSGRLESKYGHSLEDSEEGMLKTNYGYQVFTPEGIELIYRGYEDMFSLNKDNLYKCRNLRGVICGGYNPRLNEFNGNKVACNGHCKNNEFYGKNPYLVEKMRSVDNKGLVRVIAATYDKHGEIASKSEEYCFNTLIGFKRTADPFLIHINSGIKPIARIHNGKLVVNYKDLGVTPDNYKDVARTRFGTEVHNKFNEFSKRVEKLMDDKTPANEKSELPLIEALLKKYAHLYETEGLDKWDWKEASERSTRK